MRVAGIARPVVLPDVCTWRYRSFKDLNLMRPRSPITVVALGMMIYAVWFFSKPFLLVMGIAYVGSGIVVRVVGSIRRHFFPRRGIEPGGIEAEVKQ